MLRAPQSLSGWLPFSMGESRRLTASRSIPVLAFLSILSLSILAHPRPLLAQVPALSRSLPAGASNDQLRRMLEQRMATGMSNAEVVDLLRQSGMSRAEARSQMEQMGYDPNLVDPYYDSIERGGAPPPGQVSQDMLQGLYASMDGGKAGADTVPAKPADSVAVQQGGRTGPARTDTVRAAPVELFGRSLFRSQTERFAPVLTGPVGANYRLGPGDEIVLTIYGDVERAHRLRVSREGAVVIPDVGQLYVHSLTLQALEEQLYDRLGRAYSGIRRGSGATTHFTVSLGELRVNQVYVIGEVERPSAYQVSAAASVFEALYQAGGPSERGSFRQVLVQRGGKTVHTVDLYDYLIHGNSHSDVRLEQGDVIFVPPYASRVTVGGAVRRAGIYELLEGEGLKEALQYAGGVEASAVVSRVQVDRILPAEQRRPGVDRVLVDVDVRRLAADAAATPLRDGDVVQVFGISHERRSRITLLGAVQRPGIYEWHEGLTLWELIGRADGLGEQAYTPRGHIYRLEESDGTRRLIQVPLLADSAGAPLQDVMLADRDSVVIYSRSALRNPDYVTISGFVKNPGTYELTEGMTVPDLVLAAGGLTPGAHTVEVEVARLPEVGERTSRTATIFRVPLGARSTAEPTLAKGAGTAMNAIPVWVPTPEEFTLHHGDRIFVRRSPGYEMPRTVKISGEVMVPGAYVLESRQEKLVDLIERAGGLTAEGYPRGFQLIRGGKLLAVDLPRALQKPSSRYNVVLEAGDSLHLPTYDPTVLVTGAVTFESRILYEPGKSLDYYINRAGGYSDQADKKRVTVTYQDGGRAAIESALLVVHKKPTPMPGSMIYVPLKPESERRPFNWGDFLTRTTTIVTSVFTTIILAKSL